MVKVWAISFDGKQRNHGKTDVGGGGIAVVAEQEGDDLVVVRELAVLARDIS
jgi:hypothetical protein